MNNSTQLAVTNSNSTGPPRGVFINRRQYGPESDLSNLLSKIKIYMKSTPGSDEISENKEFHAACRTLIESRGKETTMPFTLLSRKLSYRLECARVVEEMIKFLDLPEWNKRRFPTRRGEREPEFKQYFRAGGISKKGERVYFYLPSFAKFSDEVNTGMLTVNDKSRLIVLKKMLRSWDVLKPVATDECSRMWHKPSDYLAFVFLAARKVPTVEAERFWSSRMEKIVQKDGKVRIILEHRAFEVAVPVPVAVAT